MFDTNRRSVLEALGIGGAGTVLGTSTVQATERSAIRSNVQDDGGLPTADRIAADPTDVPEPIDRDEPQHHEITLTGEEVVAEIEPGVEFTYLTFDGQVPGPMIRVRRGDTVELTFDNLEENLMPHNVDLHAVYGTGGGAEGTDAAPGEENAIHFEAQYPGAFIYHCAVHDLDYHISSGMFGMIVVEPEDGFPEVDRELYVSQHEIYTDGDTGEEGEHAFDFDSMTNEDPTYVTLNGEREPFTPDRYGSIEAQQDETVRLFMVNGGPNLSSAFHPIGNVFSRAWRDGALGSPEEYVQTMNVPPGSCMIGEMEMPVPSRITLVDHALSRLVRKGMASYIDVEGEDRPELFDPEPGEEDAGDEPQDEYDPEGGAPHEDENDSDGGVPSEADG